MGRRWRDKVTYQLLIRRGALSENTGATALIDLIEAGAPDAIDDAKVMLLDRMNPNCHTSTETPILVCPPLLNDAQD